MRAPTPAQLLQVWERGCGRPASARALLLLAAANEDADSEALASLPLGRRDAMLIELHARLFRDRIVGLARCPQCAVEVEAAFGCAELLAAGRGDGGDADDLQGHPARPHAIEADGATLHFRLPDSRDMLALQRCEDPAHARSTLLGRCLIAVEGEDGPLAAEALSDEQIGALSAAMAAADPLADLRLAFTCPGCAACWDAGFDPAQFLWQELHAWAVRTLREVDLIARVYHWREADILALDPHRRQAYLELCAS